MLVGLCAVLVHVCARVWSPCWYCRYRQRLLRSLGWRVQQVSLRCQRQRTVWRRRESPSRLSRAATMAIASFEEEVDILFHG